VVLTAPIPAQAGSGVSGNHPPQFYLKALRSLDRPLARAMTSQL
jgi:hypothetical protein